LTSPPPTQGFRLLCVPASPAITAVVAAVDLAVRIDGEHEAPAARIDRQSDDRLVERHGGPASSAIDALEDAAIGADVYGPGQGFPGGRDVAGAARRVEGDRGNDPGRQGRGDATARVCPRAAV